ncbi:hypothetical protein RhiirA5_401087, partial [Rhizophagus irregularis]
CQLEPLETKPVISYTNFSKLQVSNFLDNIWNLKKNKDFQGNEICRSATSWIAPGWNFEGLQVSERFLNANLNGCLLKSNQLE